MSRGKADFICSYVCVDSGVRYFEVMGLSYRIVYGPMPDVPKAGKKGNVRLRVLTALFLLLFVLAVRQAWPEGSAVLRRCLIPGEPTATEEMFHGMVSDIRSGETLGQAVTAFCKELVEYGIRETS